MALVLETVSNSKAAQRDLNNLEKSVGNLERTVTSTVSSFGTLAKTTGLIAASVASLNKSLLISDEFTNLENKIRSVTDTQKEFNSALKQIKTIAISTRSELDPITRLYSRIAVNSKQLGINQKDSLKATEAVAKTLKISGATTQEATSSLIQFGQALGAGTLQGEELRSVLEGNVVLARVIANTFKVPIGDLKKLGEQGKLLSGKILKGIIEQSEEIGANFGKLKITFGEAFGNLGTSLKLIFDSAMKSFLGSRGVIQEWINNIAIGISSIALNFDLYLYKSKAAIFFFVTDGILLFKKLWDSVKEFSIDNLEIDSETVKNWRFKLSQMTDSVMTFSKDVFESASTAFNGIVSFFTANNLFGNLITALLALKENIVRIISGIVSNIKVPAIDISGIFESLKPAYEFVKSFIEKIERLFFWLYDKVIGNSWIPDLVIGIIDWLSKLPGEALSFIKSFAEKAAKWFSGLYTSFKNSKLLGVFKQIKDTVKEFGSTTSESLKKPLKIAVESTTEYARTSDNPLVKLWKKIYEKLENLKESGRNIRETSNASRNLKQILGLPDRVPGSIYGQVIDTGAYVGRGTFRNSKDRPFGHDFINSLPSDAQIPVLAGITGTMALAIMKAFSAGPVRSVLLSVLTTVFAIAVGRLVHDQQVSKTVHQIGYGFLNIIGKGLELLFSGNVLKDPLGLFGVIAKTALLFESGRKMLLDVGKTVLTAPTGLARNLSKRFDRRLIARELTSEQKKFDKYIKDMNVSAKSFSDTISKEIRNLTTLKDASGRAIDAKDAKKAIRDKDFNAFGTAATSASVSAAIKANEQLKQVSKDLKEANSGKGSQAEALSKVKDKLGEANKAISGATDRFINGFKSLSGTLSGTLFGVAGYQIGTEIARGMSSNTPEWKKIAVILGTAVTGQALGSGLGFLLSSGIVGAFKTGVFLLTAALKSPLVISALTNPFVLGTALIGTALLAGYALFKGLPEEWKKALFNFNFLGVKGTGKLLGLQTKEEADAKGQEVITTSEFSNRIKIAQEQIKAEIFEFFASAAKKGSDSLPSTPFGVPGKATGGYISGPGTGTSDSIPAMLSNGEYVINAAATKNNLALLKMINEEGAVRKFSRGGHVLKMQTGGGPVYDETQRLINRTKPVEVEVSNLREFTKGLQDLLPFKITNENGDFSIRPFIETIKKYLNPDKSDSGIPDDRSNFRKLLESAKGDNVNKLLAKAIEDQGIKGIDPTAFKNLGGSQLANIADVLDDIKKYESRAKELGDNFLGRVAEAEAKKGRELLLKTLDEAALSYEAPSTWKTTKSEPIEFLEQLEIINKVFPKLEISLNEFYRMSDSLRETFFNTAASLNKRSTALDTQNISGDGGKQPATTERRLNLESDRRVAESELSPNIAQFRATFESVKNNLSSIGSSFSEELFAALSDSEILNVTSIAKRMRESLDAISNPNIPADMQRVAAKTLIESRKALDKALENALLTSGTKEDSTLAIFQKFGVNISKNTLLSYSDLNKSILNSIANELLSKSNDLDNNDPAIRRSAAKFIDNYVIRLNEEIGKNLEEASREAGKSFGASVSSSFSSGLSSLLKGERDEDKSYIETFIGNFLDKVTGSVIDTFVNGLTQSLTLEFGNSISNLGSNLFNLGTSLVKNDGSSPFKPLYVKDVDELVGPPDLREGLGLDGIFDKLKSDFSSLFDNIGPMLSNAFSAFTSFLGFADGGQVSGPGGPRSDSILARLSNGEFVVNANSTSKALPLLHAINDGYIPKFADGGYIGDMQAIYNSAPSRGSGNTQVIQLSVTGDVSRQTRAEILSMLPVIANGVNSRNREKGVK